MSEEQETNAGTTEPLLSDDEEEPITAQKVIAYFNIHGDWKK